MSKQSTIVFLTFLALFSFASMNMLNVAAKSQAADVEVCPDFDYRPKSFTEGLIASLNKLPRDQRKDGLVAALKKETLLVSSPDAVKIFKSVRFQREQITQVGTAVNSYILRFTPKELSEIIGGVKKRLQADLAISLKDTLSDVSPSALDVIFKSIACTKARETVIKAFEGVKRRSCVFGKMDKDVFFLIDLSGSMNYPFKKEGKTFSRLTFLKPVIVKALESFDKNTNFNIGTFATGVRVWRNEWLYATNQNKVDAIKFVNDMRAIGMTNTIEGLQSAFKIQKKEFSILLFTDGMPTIRERDTKKIVQYVVEENKSRVKRGLKPVKININAVMLGGNGTEEEKKEKADTVIFCEQLAKVTGGTLKHFK